MPPKASCILPTLSLLLSITPTVLMLILVALSARGNWGFLILGASPISSPSLYAVLLP